MQAVRAVLVQAMCCSVHMRAMCLSMQAKAVKARQDAVTEASKDDEEELLKKREEREAAKKKEEKVHLVFPLISRADFTGMAAHLVAYCDFLCTSTPLLDLIKT